MGDVRRIVTLKRVLIEPTQLPTDHQRITTTRSARCPSTLVLSKLALTITQYSESSDNLSSDVLVLQPTILIGTIAISVHVT